MEWLQREMDAGGSLHPQRHECGRLLKALPVPAPTGKRTRMQRMRKSLSIEEFTIISLWVGTMRRFLLSPFSRTSRGALLCGSLIFASLQCSPQTLPSARDPKHQTVQPRRTSEQERGLRLLKATEGEAAGLEPDMRAFVLWRASYAYLPIDPKKAESLAKDSFTASQAIEDPADKDQCGSIGSAGDIKSWIQERVLSRMIEKDQIAKAEELLPQATVPVREHITTQLVKYYVKKKDWARAQVQLSHVADSERYPYDAAGELMLAMGPEQSADRMAIFNQALSNFEQHATANGIGMQDLGTLLERTWSQLPPSVVLEAIDKMLDEAKSKESQESHSHLSMTSEKGSVNLNSTYELRLFQLLPVIEELDKDKADSLLRENAEIQAKLAKYPKGMESLTSQGNIYSYGMTDDDSPQAAQGATQQQARQQTEQEIIRRMTEIDKEPQRDPQQEINDARMPPPQAARHHKH